MPAPGRWRERLNSDAEVYGGSGVGNLGAVETEAVSCHGREHSLVLRFGVILKAGVGVELPQQVIDIHVAAARDGYFQDVAIWENKRWRDKPILADGDGPINKIRKWYRGFYPSENP